MGESMHSPGVPLDGDLLGDFVGDCVGAGVISPLRYFIA